MKTLLIGISMLLTVLGSMTPVWADALVGHHDAKLSQERIENEKNQAALNDKNRPVADALAVVLETRSAIQFIDNNNVLQAKAALERALGKTDVLLSTHPDLTLIPTAVDVKVIDTKIDPNSLKRITSEATTMVNAGRYQAARLLLRNLASEIDIVTENIPIATYPQALRAATVSLDENNKLEAREQLFAALHSLAIVETAVPIPLIRAQVLVDEVSQPGNKVNRDEALRLINDADAQVAWAEKLGYGRNGDFKELRASIVSLRENLNKNRESRGLLAKVKNSLQSLKEKITSI